MKFNTQNQKKKNQKNKKTTKTTENYLRHLAFFFGFLFSSPVDDSQKTNVCTNANAATKRKKDNKKKKKNCPNQLCSFFSLSPVKRQFYRKKKNERKNSYKTNNPNQMLQQPALLQRLVGQQHITARELYSFQLAYIIIMIITRQNRRAEPALSQALSFSLSLSTQSS